MNIQTNPWNFVPGDVVNLNPTASPAGLIQQATLALILATFAAPHGLVKDQFVTLINVTNAGYNGWYKVYAAPSPTTLLLVSLSTPTQGSPINTILAPSGGGSVVLNQVQQNVRVEDISWQLAAAQGDTLDIRDRNGLPVWQAAATAPGSQNRGKVYWVDGITVVQMSSGTALLTIN